MITKRHCEEPSRFAQDKLRDVAISGILLIDKPAGPTSFRVVSKIKRHFNLKKVGHGGTLDPFATGLLVILIGKSTKTSATFLEHDKTYEGVIALGKETDTYDITGKVINEIAVEDISEAKIKQVFKSFEGLTEQRPPLFSAIKVNGKKAYELARQGKEVELKKRDVNIYFFKVVKVRLPKINFATKVSKGTYIRSLAHDIGVKMGTGACLEELRRTSSGDFSIKDAFKLEDVLKWSRVELESNLRSGKS